MMMMMMMKEEIIFTVRMIYNKGMLTLQVLGKSSVVLTFCEISNYYKLPSNNTARRRNQSYLT
jgi:hypothetical protein